MLYIKNLKNRLDFSVLKAPWLATIASMDIIATGDFMKKSNVLENHFIGARSQLIDIAAFLDRLERSQGEDDFRSDSFRACIPILSDNSPDKAKRILELLSDPTITTINKAREQGAAGAWPEFPSTDS